MPVITLGHYAIHLSDQVRKIAGMARARSEPVLFW